MWKRSLKLSTQLVYFGIPRVVCQKMILVQWLQQSRTSSEASLGHPRQLSEQPSRNFNFQKCRVLLVFAPCSSKRRKRLCPFSPERSHDRQLSRFSPINLDLSPHWGPQYDPPALYAAIGPARLETYGTSSEHAASKVESPRTLHGRGMSQREFARRLHHSRQGWCPKHCYRACSEMWLLTARPTAAAAGPGLTPYALAPSIRFMPVKGLTNGEWL